MQLSIDFKALTYSTAVRPAPSEDDLTAFTDLWLDLHASQAPGLQAGQGPHSPKLPTPPLRKGSWPCHWPVYDTIASLEPAYKYL